MLADSLAAIHLAYLAYVVLGQVAILIGWPLQWRWIRNPWFRISHLAMILIVAAEAVVDFENPFSTWGREFRSPIGQVKVELQGGEWDGVSFVTRTPGSSLDAGRAQ